MDRVTLTAQERETIILMRSFDGEQLAAAFSLLQALILNNKEV